APLIHGSFVPCRNNRAVNVASRTARYNCCAIGRDRRFSTMRLPLFDLSPDAQQEWLARALARPAPESARALSDGFRFPGREGEAMPAAVLVPLVNRPHGLQVLLTVRSATLADHPSQISFPGGRLDDGDPSPAAAALREAQEEVGLAPERVSVLGALAE